MDGRRLPGILTPALMVFFAEQQQQRLETELRQWQSEQQQQEQHKLCPGGAGS